MDDMARKAHIFFVAGLTFEAQDLSLSLACRYQLGSGVSWEKFTHFGWSTSEIFSLLVATVPGATRDGAGVPQNIFRVTIGRIDDSHTQLFPVPGCNGTVFPGDYHGSVAFSHSREGHLW